MYVIENPFIFCPLATFFRLQQSLTITLHSQSTLPLWPRLTSPHFPTAPIFMWERLPSYGFIRHIHHSPCANSRVLHLEKFLLALGKAHVGGRRSRHEHRQTKGRAQLYLYFRKTYWISEHTISSGAFSSGSSMSDLNGCNSSGIHDERVRGSYMSEFDGRGVCDFAAYQLSSHNQSIASKNAARTTPASLPVCR